MLNLDVHTSYSGRDSLLMNIKATDFLDYMFESNL